MDLTRFRTIAGMRTSYTFMTRFISVIPFIRTLIQAVVTITVNRNRMVRLAGPRDKYVIVNFYFWSRDDERGGVMFEKAILHRIFVYILHSEIKFLALFQYVRMRLNF